MSKKANMILAMAAGMGMNIDDIIPKVPKHPSKRLCGVKSPVEEGKIKIGRNELCPCESGKKYKKCCLKNPV